MRGAKGKEVLHTVPTVLIACQYYAIPATFLYNRTAYLRQLAPVVAAFQHLGPKQFQCGQFVQLASRHPLVRLVNGALRRLRLIPWDDSVELGMAFRNVLQTVRPAVIHVEGGWAGVRLVGELERAKQPIAVSFWGSDINAAQRDARYRGNLPRLFAVADLCLFPSRYLYECACRMGCPVERCRIISPGVEVPELPNRPVGHGSARLLSVGRLSAMKGPEVLLEAVRLLAESGCRFRWHHIGAGELEAEIRSRAQKMGIAPHIEFCGLMSPAAVHTHMAESDILVHPSVRCPDGQEESFGVVLAEAGAHGLPVVASAIGGIPEIVEHGTTGILVPERDPRALADAIVRLVDNPAERRALGEAARKRVMAHFELQQQVTKHEAALLSLLASKDT